MQNPREGTLRQGEDGGVESSATAAIWFAQDLPSTNEAWQEEDPAVTSMHARTAPAPGLTSPSEVQMASFQVMETVVAKFGVEDNLGFLPEVEDNLGFLLQTRNSSQAWSCKQLWRAA